MTSAGGHSFWSRTSVRGSEMPIPVTGARSSTTCEFEAIPGAQMQVSTPPPAVSASTLCPLHSVFAEIQRFRADLLSFLFLRWPRPVPLRVSPPSCLLLVPQTFDLRRKSWVGHLTADLLGLVL